MVLNSIWEQLEDVKDEAISGTKMRWKVSYREIKNMEPFVLYNSQQVISRVHDHVKIVLKEGIKWVGCRYQCPMIWFPRPYYEFDFKLSEVGKYVDF